MIRASLAALFWVLIVSPSALAGENAGIFTVAHDQTWALADDYVKGGATIADYATGTRHVGDTVESAYAPVRADASEQTAPVAAFADYVYGPVLDHAIECAEDTARTLKSLFDPTYDPRHCFVSTLA